MVHSLPEVRRISSLLFLCALLSSPLTLAAQTNTAQPQHPLDPLTADEIKSAAGVITALPQFPAGSLFSTIEERRAELQTWRSSQSAGFCRDSRSQG
jgi:Cu2+-containing amine oxidase